MARATTKLQVTSRTPDGSRAARRLRREGRVPGVLYGGGGENISFEVDARELRLALAAAGAVLDLSIDGGASTPVVLKDAQRDVVRGQSVHVDLLRVRLDTAIQAVVPLELTGVDDAPGVKEGGTLEHITRELNVEALPTAIPESIQHDVSAMEINDTLTLAAVRAPEGVTLLDDPEETVIATLSPPRLQDEDDEEIESETQVVGESEAGAEGEATGEAGGGSASGGDSDG
jgi:large subunit ribosomal protein L25